MFQLYQQERSVFGFDDYGTLLSEVERINAKTVLEFGPGVSTLAFVEANCSEIVTLEYQARWINAAKNKLWQHRNVRILPYENKPEINIPDLEDSKFDVIFVDSPMGTDLPMATKFRGQEDCSRFNTVSWSLRHAPVVLLHDAKRPGEERTLARIIGKVSHIEMLNTAKGIARITC